MNVNVKGRSGSDFTLDEGVRMGEGIGLVVWFAEPAAGRLEPSVLREPSAAGVELASDLGPVS
jgi:hypothetical protein